MLVLILILVCIGVVYCIWQQLTPMKTGAVENLEKLSTNSFAKCIRYERCRKA